MEARVPVSAASANPSAAAFPPPAPEARRRGLLLAGCAAAAVAAVLLLLHQDALPREAAFMVGIFVLAALLWTTQALPLFATSLLVVALQIVLLANPGDWPGLGFEAAAGPSYVDIVHTAADPVLLLFFGGFLLARAAVKEGVDRTVAAVILRPFGGRPGPALLGLMLATVTFSMWMSNTATTAMMVALVAPMLASLPPGERFRKALVLGIPFAANVGGMGTPIASPPNAVALSYLRSAGLNVGFLEWMLVAVPLMTGLVLITWLLLWTRYRPQTAGLMLHSEPRAMTRRGAFVVAVFFVTVAGWLTEPLHGLPAAVVALLPVVAFTAGGILRRADVDSLEWSVLILIAGGIALGGGMRMTGLDAVIARLLSQDLALAGLAALAVLVLLTLVLGTFMSNTAAANLVLPVGISLAVAAQAGGGVVIQTAMSIALVASVSMALPVSTPPNAIAFARGELAMRDMARNGALIGVIAAALIILFSGAVVRFWGLDGSN
jgi:solute carrier family 13 (sodium-dependent dicarboxylate transporter), member 2/3/5